MIIIVDSIWLNNYINTHNLKKAETTTNVFIINNNSRKVD